MPPARDTPHNSAVSTTTRVGALPRLQEPEHPPPVEQAVVAMALFQRFLILDCLRVVYLWHGFIVPPMKRIGIALSS